MAAFRSGFFATFGVICALTFVGCGIPVFVCAGFLGFVGVGFKSSHVHLQPPAATEPFTEPREEPQFIELPSTAEATNQSTDDDRPVISQRREPVATRALKKSETEEKMESLQAILRRMEIEPARDTEGKAQAEGDFGKTDTKTDLLHQAASPSIKIRGDVDRYRVFMAVQRLLADNIRLAEKKYPPSDARYAKYLESLDEDGTDKILFSFGLTRTQFSGIQMEAVEKRWHKGFSR